MPEVAPDRTTVLPCRLASLTHRVIQAAVDYVARLGGGTVRILPGGETARVRSVEVHGEHVAKKS